MAYDEHLADRIRELMGTEPAVAEKKMFGGLAFLIGGHIAVAASGGGGLLVRSDPAQCEKALAAGRAEPMVMRGKEMAGWLRVSTEGVKTKRQLERWVKMGVAHARSLPPGA